MSSFYTCAPNITIMMYASWDMEYDRQIFLSFWSIFCPFTPLLTPEIKIWNKCKKTRRYYPITHVNNKWRSYDAWSLRYKAQQTEFFVILGHYLPFDPPNNLKKQSFEKMKKTHEDNIILHLHTTNDDHTMYSSWDIERNRQNFLSFWTNFCPFTPLTTQKIKILKKWKTYP